MNKPPTCEERKAKRIKKKKLIHCTLFKGVMIIPTAHTHLNPESVYIYIYIMCARVCINEH